MYIESETSAMGKVIKKIRPLLRRKQEKLDNSMSTQKQIEK